MVCQCQLVSIVGVLAPAKRKARRLCISTCTEVNRVYRNAVSEKCRDSIPPWSRGQVHGAPDAARRLLCACHDGALLEICHFSATRVETQLHLFSHGMLRQIPQRDGLFTSVYCKKLPSFIISPLLHACHPVPFLNPSTHHRSPAPMDADVPFPASPLPHWDCLPPRRPAVHAAQSRAPLAKTASCHCTAAPTCGMASGSDPVPLLDLALIAVTRARSCWRRGLMKPLQESM